MFQSATVSIALAPPYAVALGFLLLISITAIAFLAWRHHREDQP
jgi:hypothetical protein